MINPHACDALSNININSLCRCYTLFFVCLCSLPSKGKGEKLMMMMVGTRNSLDSRSTTKVDDTQQLCSGNNLLKLKLKYQFYEF